MFEFTRQTIINSQNYLGKPVISVKTDDDGHKTLVILGYFKFKESQVDYIYERDYRDGTPASVTFDLDKIADVLGDEDPVGTYRFSFYIGLAMSSQDSFYANNLVYKGKPLYVEFPVTKADLDGEGAIKASKVIPKIKDIIKKYSLLYTDEDLLVVEDEGSKITFKGKYDYQIIRSAVLEKYNPAGGMTVACCSNLGEYEPIITGVVKTDPEWEPADNETEITRNIESFGNYAWMIHNLRIPTGYNTRWDAPLPDEAPMAGGKYTQFTIHMSSGPRIGIAGEAVGMGVISHTTHVFYVESALVNSFKTAFNSIKTIEVIEESEEATTEEGGSGDNTQNSGSDNQNTGDNTQNPGSNTQDPGNG